MGVIRTDKGLPGLYGTYEPRGWELLAQLHKEEIAGRVFTWSHTNIGSSKPSTQNRLEV
jgi:hypothetical protein